MRIKYVLCILFFAGLSSCVQSPAQEKPDIDPRIILKDFNSWWTYNYRNVDLSADFTPLDIAGVEISKEVFLEQLSLGGYIALNIFAGTPGKKLRLYKLDANTDKDILTNAKSVGEEAWRYYKVEGAPLPGSGFTDINGRRYDKAALAGKIVVIKCWFIHCLPCVQEMPALNEAIKKFRKRSDVVFVSLATDTAEELKAFLQKTKFDYAVVAGQADYMNNELKVSGYPTHLVVSRSGNIVKMTNRYEQMLASLEKEMEKQR